MSVEEALANTQWSVLTPGGDVVKEAIGAFPKVVLAEGEYSVVAVLDANMDPTVVETFTITEAGVVVQGKAATGAFKVGEVTEQP